MSILTFRKLCGVLIRKKSHIQWHCKVLILYKKGSKSFIL